MEFTVNNVEETAALLETAPSRGKHGEWLAIAKGLEPGTSISFRRDPELKPQAYRVALNNFLKKEDILLKIIIIGDNITVARVEKLVGQS